MKLPRIQLSRYLGCMVGGAAGDALGRVTEGLSRQQIRDRFGRITEYRPHLTRKGEVRPGTFTDDTHLMLLTAESLISQNQVDIEHLIDNYTLALHLDLGVAGTTQRALELREEGKDIAILGKGRHAGAGAATRMLPLALHNPHDLEQLEKDTEAVARITHVDGDSVTAAVAVAFSLAWAVKDELYPYQLFPKLRALSERRESNLAYTLAQAEQLLLKGIKAEEAIEELGNDGAAVRLIPTALYAFLRSPNNFYESIVAAVNAGGDADTRAAIAGGLSGAYNGLDRIPAQFAKRLVEGSRVLHDAHALYQMAVLSDIPIAGLSS